MLVLVLLVDCVLVRVPVSFHINLNHTSVRVLVRAGINNELNLLMNRSTRSASTSLRSLDYELE